MNDTNELFAALFKIAFSLITSILSSLYWGWALMTLWGWFAVTGAGLTALVYPIWLGVTFLVSHDATAQLSLSDVKKAEEFTWAEQTLWSVGKIFLSLIGLGLAWVVFIVLI